ncbi:MAG: hypothetical protein CMQ24_05990 [Gammaproteobacteria bacterium]|nr:hypothetical protein [Gammaproteobacteria bacterium]
MSHVLEPASSGRAKCRGCGRPIEKGELRFGERMPNLYGEGDMTLWFHLACATWRRPEAVTEFLEEGGDVEVDRSALQAATEHHRLQRIAGVERASSGRARCRHCRETIDKDTWRIRLAFYEEGTFNPSGFIHMACAQGYVGTAELMPLLETLGAVPDNADKTEIAALLHRC